MTAAYIAPLNLEYIFQNVLAGSPDIFIGLFFITLAILAGYFKMSGENFLIMMGLSGIILYSWLQGGWFIFTIIIGGMILIWMISKMIRD